MFSVSNNIAQINGIKGKYDGVVANNSVRYGRNAIDNFKAYLATSFTQPKLDSDAFESLTIEDKCKYLIENCDEEMENMPPLDYAIQYMPEVTDGKNIDKQALLAAAYEEMGAESISTEELDKKIKESLGENYTSEALDLNKDGNVDVAEYSTSLLVEDACDVDADVPLNETIDGVITNKGSNSLAAFANKANVDIAYQTYSSLYSLYNLGEAKQEFLADKNNIA